MSLEIVQNCISKFKGLEYGNTQNYRGQYVDEEEDNTAYFDECVREDLEILERDPAWPFVPAQASPLTCGVFPKRNAR